MTLSQWSFGDRVIHQSRPEWGVGTVTKAMAVKQDGAACQNLTIRFERAGVKTISTAFARLRQATDHEDALGEAENGSLAVRERPEEVFARLPEAARDPFSSLESRFKATLGLYRFAPEGGSLLDWASMQTGMQDPLSEYARPELEALFKRFAQARDEHLRSLAADLIKQTPVVVRSALDSASPQARAALRRLDGLRCLQATGPLIRLISLHWISRGNQ